MMTKNQLTWWYSAMFALILLMATSIPTSDWSILTLSAVLLITALLYRAYIDLSSRSL